jgi:lysylphosphatidylglycerol synthetase-like protein (DUF2156 family)
MATSSNSNPDINDKRENLRGIFVLGLLAILIVVRYQNPTLKVTIGQSNPDITPLINITILCLSLYAFFMVLGASDDVIGKHLSEMFRNLSKMCLWLDFSLSAILGIIYFVVGYSTRAIWILTLMLFCIVFVSVLSIARKIKLREILKKHNITRLDLLERIATILFLAFLAAMFYYPDEQYLVIFFILGFICFISFCLVRETKVSHNAKKPN